MDRVDIELLLALNSDPRATAIALADRAGVSRNTVHGRLGRLEQTLAPFERRIEPSLLGYPLTAYIGIRVTQRLLDDLGRTLATLPEVLEVLGVSGAVDLLCRVVARDADDLYRLAGAILDMDGVERTETALVMRQLVGPRIGPLLERHRSRSSDRK